MTDATAIVRDDFDNVVQYSLFVDEELSKECGYAVNTNVPTDTRFYYKSCAMPSTITCSYLPSAGR